FGEERSEAALHAKGVGMPRPPHRDSELEKRAILPLGGGVLAVVMKRLRQIESGEERSRMRLSERSLPRRERLAEELLAASHAARREVDERRVVPRPEDEIVIRPERRLALREKLVVGFPRLLDLAALVEDRCPRAREHEPHLAPMRQAPCELDAAIDEPLGLIELPEIDEHLRETAQGLEAVSVRVAERFSARLPRFAKLRLGLLVPAQAVVGPAERRVK